MDYGFISVTIPLIVIILAVLTKKIISSLVAGIPLMAHVKSQLPYSITGIVLSLVLSLIFAV